MSNFTNITLPGMKNYFTEEAYKVLRTNMQFCGRDIKAIAITSCDFNEGKTVISLHLGVSLAELGKKVIVLDCDLRKSVMEGRNTDTKNARGLSEYLSGLCTFDECKHSTQFPTLDIVFSGKYPPNPAELLGSQHFNQLIKDLKEEYDYVILDTPPLGLVIDAAVVAEQCDGSMIVIGVDRNRTSVVQSVVEQLRKSGSNVLGVVLNKYGSKTKRSSGKYYKEYYKKHYKSYGNM